MKRMVTDELEGRYTPYFFVTFILPMWDVEQMATCYRSHQKKLSTKLITRFDFFTYDPIENIYIPIEVHILYRATDFILVSTRGLCTPECGYR